MPPTMQICKKLVSCSPVSAQVNETSQSRRLLIIDRSNNIKYLVDTGSDVSIVPARNAELRYRPTGIQLHAANGSSIKVFGSRYIDVNLGLRRKFSWNFLIANVGTAILGADFLANFGLLVDVKNHRLIDERTGLHAPGGIAVTPVF